MKRFMSALGVGMLCAGLVLTLMPRPVAAANSPVATAGKALMAAFAKGDKATIEKYLDADFSWIDTDGVQVVRALLGKAPRGMEVAAHHRNPAAAA
jgi:hypothetical protein